MVPIPAGFYGRLRSTRTGDLAAPDKPTADEIDAYAADETIHHHHRAASELWKTCFTRGGGVMPSSSPGSSTE
jgi:hypothetical protein